MRCWGFLAAPRQHQVDEREAKGEIEGKAEDERQRGRGVGSKACVRRLKIKRVRRMPGEGGGSRERGAHPL